MDKPDHDISFMRYARLGGLLYLVIIMCGISSELLVRARLIVDGDAAATAANIMQSGGLFRAGLAADVIMLFCDVAIAVLFYLLFRPVGQALAMVAAVFRLTQASILGFNLLNYHTPLLLLDGSGYPAQMDTAQLHALVMLFLEMHAHGYDLGLLFFAVSNLVLGYLVIRSGFMPALFGYGLQAAALVYLAGSLARFIVPDWLVVIEPFYIIPLVAELAFCLWLLFKGVRTTGTRAAV